MKDRPSARDPSRVFSLLKDDPEKPADADQASTGKVKRVFEGMEVVEHKVGRAVGQWVLEVRCQCGRRWFELEEIEAATCPRCGLLVYVEVRERPK